MSKTLRHNRAGEVWQIRGIKDSLFLVIDLEHDAVFYDKEDAVRYIVFFLHHGVLDKKSEFGLNAWEHENSTKERLL